MVSAGAEVFEPSVLFEVDVESDDDDDDDVNKIAAPELLAPAVPPPPPSMCNSIVVAFGDVLALPSCRLAVGDLLEGERAAPAPPTPASPPPPPPPPNGRY